jgi:tetratricopeptide (TPR) repeat protein
MLMKRDPLLISSEARRGIFRRVWTWILFLALGTTCFCSAGDNPAPELPVLRVVILPFENVTDDPELDALELGLPDLLRLRLSEARALEVLEGDGLRRPLASIGWKRGDAVDREIGPEIAATLGADLLMWGRFDHNAESGQKRVKVSVCQRDSEGEDDGFEAKGDLWNEIVGIMAAEITSRLGRPLQGTGCWQWEKRGTASDAALLELVRSSDLKRRNALFEEHEEALRRALEADAECAVALARLSALLAREKRFAECDLLLEELTTKHPEWCKTYFSRFFRRYVSKDLLAARRELERALEMHPGCPGATWSLYMIAVELQDSRGVQEHLTIASARHPTAYAMHILLAEELLRTGDTENAKLALSHVRDAWRYTTYSSASGITVAGLLGASYRVGNLQLFSDVVRWLGAQAAENPEIVELLGQIFSDGDEQDSGKGRLVIPRPIRMTAEEIDTELAQRLTPEQRALLTNPLEMTPAIQAEAIRLTEGIVDDYLRAIILFTEVAKRGRGPGDGGSRTAAEALAASADPDAGLSCQEHAKLLITLARAVGLEAYLVHVERLASGAQAYHDCVALFVNDQSYLLDPKLGVFGVEHGEFVVLNDLQAIAHQAMQGNSDHESVLRLKAGLKLDPDDLWTRISFVRNMIDANELKDAGVELERILGEGHKRWDIHLAAAALAEAEHRRLTALSELQRALEMNPSNAVVHLRLAGIYLELGNSAKAAQHGKKGLQFDGGELTRDARLRWGEHVSFMRADAKAKSKEPGSREALEDQAVAGDVAAQMALALALSEEGDQDGAMTWLLRAAEQGHAEAQRNYGVNLLALQGEKAVEEAIRWLERSAHQGNPGAQYELGRILWQKRFGPRDQAEACFWTVLAERAGHTQARHHLIEIEWTISAAQVTEAKRRADAFVPQRETEASP